MSINNLAINKLMDSNTISLSAKLSLFAQSSQCKYIFEYSLQLMYDKCKLKLVWVCYNRANV